MLALTGCTTDNQPNNHGQGWSYTIKELAPGSIETATIMLHDTSPDIGRTVMVCIMPAKELPSCDSVKIIGTDGRTDEEPTVAPENDGKAPGGVKITALLDGKQATQLFDNQGTLTATIKNIGEYAQYGVLVTSNPPVGVEFVSADKGTIQK